MIRIISLIFFLTVVWARKPVHQYRYQTEDVMKSDATSIPVRGYHVVEGGYYPEHFGEYSGGFDGAGAGGFGGGHGGGRYIDSPSEFRGGFYPSAGSKFIGGGYGGSGYIGGELSPSIYHHHGTGGEYLDKHVHSGGKKDISDQAFEKTHGRKDEEIGRGQEGYNQGKVALSNNKGGSGYYSALDGRKKSSEDGKANQGGQYYNQEGKNGEEKKQKGFHKKGHVIKGFKSSHHKDEDGKTEEFYDEEHNDGQNNKFGGQAGSYGENSGSFFKGGVDNGQFKAEENKKEGHYNSHHIVDNSNADKGQYDEKKYSGNGQVYGSQNGIDQQSLVGHQEAKRIFKHRPYHVPLFPVY